MNMMNVTLITMISNSRCEKKIEDFEGVHMAYEFYEMSYWI
jgi:hypothetical protein